MKRAKIIFFSSSSFSLPLLERLAENFSLKAIITRPDKPVGRKKILTPSLPKQFAQKKNIPVFQPAKKEELENLRPSLAKIKPDLGLVADYGLFIPREIFTLPGRKTLNLHFSRLPQFRGPAPVQYTLLTGQPFAWISLALVAKKIDAGEIIWQKRVKLSGEETAESLYSKLFSLSAQTLPFILKNYLCGKILPKKQQEGFATYTKRFSREDGFVPFSLFQKALQGKNPSRKEISLWPLFQRLPGPFALKHFPESLFLAWRALTSWPGLWTLLPLSPRPKRLKILQAHLERRAVHSFFVPDLVQLEGKKPVSWETFQKGYSSLFEKNSKNSIKKVSLPDH